MFSFDLALPRKKGFINVWRKLTGLLRETKDVKLSNRYQEPIFVTKAASKPSLLIAFDFWEMGVADASVIEIVARSD